MKRFYLVLTLSFFLQGLTLQVVSAQTYKSMFLSDFTDKFSFLTCGPDFVVKQPLNAKTKSEALEKMDSTLSDKSKSIYTYDENLNIFRTSVYEVSSFEHRLKSQEDYTFDENDNISLITEVTYDAYSNVSLKKLDDFEHDSNGNITAVTQYEWNETEYIPLLLMTATYTTAGKPESIVLNAWENNTWIPYLQSFYTYETETKFDLAELYVWNSAENFWVNYFKVDNFTYDEMGNLSYFEAFSYNPQTQTWTTAYKRTSYFGNGYNIESETAYRFENGEWVGEYQNSYNYDYTVQYADLVIPYQYELTDMLVFDNIQNANKQTGIISYVWNGSEFVIDEVFTHYYSSTVTQTENTEQSLKIIVKNNILEVHTDEQITNICVYDIQGRLLGITNSDKINIELVHGIYLVSVKTALGKVYIRKMIVNSRKN